ncbi:siderophore-interacting protein [Actinokineospora pegani]|uniref:siderophore-interacting protein n=1 Tax=Actinokineospora pegani TaxID=2654637 RepID=UPI0012EA986F|nr:siderophore-interacting protein [Actinokineospora pegani]
MPPASGRDTLRPYRLTVVGRAMVTPSTARITLTGPGLADYTPVGPEPRCKVLLPPAPGAPVVVPDGDGFWDAVRALPDAERPVVRTYTVRAARPAVAEIDVDFVLHGDHGPAARWARAAAPGDEVGLFGCLSSFDPPADSAGYLLVGDDTALPAVAGILAGAPAGLPVRALVEVDSPADEQPLPSPAAAGVTWVHRRGTRPGGEDLLLSAVRALDRVDPATYAWVAGEASMVRAVRAHLVLDRDLTRQRVYFSGYWRRGLAEDA